ncbi:glycosyltransferase family 2 protein [Zavarzinella formosa]|uniref:glycosyltransferase family 2 protein n=1 Tax=Zavarzinella formosa TaxID=360055 RepID=UPI0002EA0080|nr:glycosyltransferase family 2 protein [Zavarzinella formosa]
METKTISVVVPMKDEADNVESLYRRVRESLPEPLQWELICVDDGSTDDTFVNLSRLAAADHRIKVIRLRRNFGQAAAMQAGIDVAVGDLVATMDGDLQNDPSDIPEMIKKLEEGYDVVLGLRQKRKDSMFIRKVPSIIANKLIRTVTKLPFKDFGCTLRVMTRDVASHMRIYGEMHRFIPVLANNLGAKMTQIPVKHHPRTAGKSKYGIGRTGRVILDLLTIKFMSSYLTRPMHFMGGIGLFFVGGAFVSLFATIAMKLLGGVDMTGNPLLLLSVLFTLAGIQLLSVGLLGEVTMRTYFESQHRRPYVMRESLNIGDDEWESIHRRRAG